MVVDVLIWVLLYFPPPYEGQDAAQAIRQSLPLYISVWQNELACHTKAGKLNEFMWGKPEGGESARFACVREKLRDSGDPND